MNNLNPANIIQAIRMGQNPQQIMLGLLQSNMGSSPIGQNLIELAQRKDAAGIEQVARNLFASNGRDFDSEFQAFKHQFGLE